MNTKYVKFCKIKLKTKVQYAEYRYNNHLRMETETVAHGNPTWNSEFPGSNPEAKNFPDSKVKILTTST